MKKCICCRLSHQNPATYLFRAVLVSVQISLLIQTRTLFHWGRVIMDYELYGILVKIILMLDLFNLLSSPDVNWWTGVLWIIVMFLSDSHSDGTHSLQSIHCWDTDAETHFYKPDEETNSSWSQMNWGWGYLHFWLNYRHILLS